MLKSLRNRLIFSHLLPLLIIIPLMGIALIYVLETWVYLPNLTNELESDARLLAAMTVDEPGIWQDPQLAQALLNRKFPFQTARVMLIDPGRVLLASSDPNDAAIQGQQIDLSGMEDVFKGQVIRRTRYNSRFNADVIDVTVPVISTGGEILGIVRMTYRFETFASEFYQLRFLIAGLLAFGLVTGSALGYFLAVSLESPIRDVTQAVDDLAQGSRTQLLKVYGPEETQKLAQAVNFLVTRLRGFEQSRHQLLANLVHELGRPLGALRSAIQALARGAEKDPTFYQELVRGMDDEAERLQHLLEELAHLHDQVLGPLELDRKNIQLAVWLPTIMRTWQASAEENGLAWEVHIPEVLPMVKADPVRLAQVFGNLFSNAIKFTPPGGKITVLAAAQDDQLAVTIQDTGPGIPAEEQEKIFNPFYHRQDGPRFPQGMGLGLSIARDLVTAHGGRIDLESAAGKGSTFTVWLPCIPDFPPVNRPPTGS